MNNDNLLKLLKSDLKDTSNPEVLARWPNLANPQNIQELKERIEVL